jgi:hypothetical protein
MLPSEREALRAFRSHVYRSCGCRRDALFDLMDAILIAPVIESPAYLSLAPTFQRRWGSVDDALNQGTMALPALAELIAGSPLTPPTEWYAIDASVWPRCDAETSPERGYYHHPTRQSHGYPIVAGWNDSWLVHVPERWSSWVAPRQVHRMLPGENVNQVAAEQVRALLRQPPPQDALPIITCDAGYDPVQLGVALAHEAVCVRVQFRSGRCFDAPPAPTHAATPGRPRRHGAPCACADPTTWPPPTAEWEQMEGQYGAVRLRAWADVQAIPQNHPKRGTRQANPIVTGTLIRLEVEHLPRPTTVPVPLWLWWWGPIPPDLETIWRVYIARFAIVHLVRFFKQTLKWTAPKLRSPASADRWTWLLIRVSLQLRLGRTVVQAHRLPWHPPLPNEQVTPARVRRAFSALLPLVGSPVAVPQPCGRSPGRPNGRRSPPAQRFPAVTLTP